MRKMKLKKSLFVSYQQEIAFAKIVLWGRGCMKGMAWRWPSLALSPDVWPASDPEPGLGRKAEEGGQERLCSPWVGSATLGLANGPAAIRLVCRYAGGRCSDPRRRGSWVCFKKKKKDPPLDNCEARAAGDPSAHLSTLGATVANRPVLIFPAEPSQRSRNCGRLVLLGLV